MRGKTWINPKNIMRSEQCLTQKSAKVCDLIFMKFLEKQQLISGGGKIRIITTS